MTTYKTEMYGMEIEMTANFAEASCPVVGDMHGRQVADFSHYPARAMRAILEDSITESGDDPEDFTAEIDDAINAMTESDA